MWVTVSAYLVWQREEKRKEGLMKIKGGFDGKRKRTGRKTKTGKKGDESGLQTLSMARMMTMGVGEKDRMLTDLWEGSGKERIRGTL